MEPNRIDSITNPVSKPDPKRRFTEIQSRLLDLEALLEELLSSRAHGNDACPVGVYMPKAVRRERELWNLFDERWLRLRPLLQYACFAELESAFLAAREDVRQHPKTPTAKDHMRRLKVLWSACMDIAAR